MLGKIVCRHKGEDMRFEGLETWIVVDLGRRILDGSVHPLSLAIRPWMIGSRQLVDDTMLTADTVEDVTAKASQEPQPLSRDQRHLASLAEVQSET